MKIGALSAAALILTMAAQHPAFSASPPLPNAPVVLNVIDVGGALALIQKGFDAYKASHPTLVSRINYVKAPAPELAGKIKAQEDAGKVDFDIVLTGSDGLAAGL